jgi:2-keto-4-pentenoate hydratase/2-oxohepta-3-ene-1,7-dioic acid hydratase in catechol pathway
VKLVKFEKHGRCASGVVLGEDIAVLGGWHPDPGEYAPFEAVRLMRPEGSARNAQIKGLHERVRLAEVSLLAPVDTGSKIICVGANYRDHAAEIGMAADGPPQIFLRCADSLVGHGAVIVRPAVSVQLDFEAELAVVIGQPGRHIPAHAAMAHVLGYTCFMDGSVRDFQRHGVSAGKNFWRSGAMGPWLVTRDAFKPAPDVALRAVLNDQQVQAGTLGMMVHSIAELIAYCSQWTPLAPGDVIATGTPAGIGSRRTPPLWMASGDRLEVHIDGIGSLRNTVVDELPA